MASLEEKRHTLAHLLASAVLERYPHAKATIGPAIDTGFYYDFDFSGGEAPGEAELATLQSAMEEMLPSWTAMSGTEVSEKDARDRFKDNLYKLEIIDGIVAAGDPITLYTADNFTDLCKGGHAEHPAHDLKVGTFELERIAGAYWRGDEKNPMLTRIYGRAFETKEELEAYRAQQEEAKKRDHKKLGKELDLFVFSETVGKGLPLFTPKGATIRRELERFIVDEEIKRGYLHVYTPDIAKIDLYKKSGHYPHYKDSMYAPIVIDEDEFMLRPMTCPHHFELYLRKPVSYRELPMRIAELAQLYRYEQSGELSGLQRVRTFCLADAHIVTASEEQAIEEVEAALALIEHVAGTFGLIQGEDYWYRLSLGDRADTEKYYQNDAAWEKGESLLREMLEKRGKHFVEAKGEAAFYGPKVDIQMKNVNGKEDTAFTVQYDFCMPERFDLTYVAQDGSHTRAFVVHRSSIGAIERIMAFLIEKYGGAFPTWLSPTQVRVLPVSEKHAAYAQEVCASLASVGIRAEHDSANESLGKKIRNAKGEKIPYMLVVGDAEIEAGTVSVESRDEGKLDAMKVGEFAERVSKEIAERR
ncbi:MAG: threonine--tRNA ligase [Patescibacteria group bacterium]